MKVYRFFSNNRFFKSYSAKVMIIAFAGINLPLIAIVGTLIFFSSFSVIDKVAIIILTLGFTAMASVIVMHLISGLLAPVRKVQVSLTGYLKYGGMPSLPESFDDELGLLMRTVNGFVSNMHNKLTEKDQQIKFLSRDLRAPGANILTHINALKNKLNPAEIENHLKKIDALINRQLILMGDMDNYHEDKINTDKQRLNIRTLVNKSSKVLL